LINTPGFSLGTIEILVLDEADKLLEMGFLEELEQIIDNCPKQRQTMLFSATMTDEIGKLIKLSLKNPIRIAIGSRNDVSSTLTQEFIKIKSEEQKEAILLSLCEKSFHKETIIFVNQKVTARRLRILFYLRGLKVSELHSDLSQDSRFKSLEKFTEKKTNFLICTDIASRGNLTI
jgi:ATP-dependent RNA helicase DDX27